MFGIGKLGPMELGLIVLLILIIFGAGKLPNVMRDFGKSIREFRKAHDELPDELPDEKQA